MNIFITNGINPGAPWSVAMNVQMFANLRNIRGNCDALNEEGWSTSQEAFRGRLGVWP